MVTIDTTAPRESRSSAAHSWASAPGAAAKYKVRKKQRRRGGLILLLNTELLNTEYTLPKSRPLINAAILNRKDEILLYSVPGGRQKISQMDVPNSFNIILPEIVQTHYVLGIMIPDLKERAEFPINKPW
jgi:hypothetical protein